MLALAPAVSRAAVLLAVAAVAAAQGVTQSIAPSASPPPGCAASHQGLFGISAVALAGSKRELEERDACATNALTMSLSNSILTDPRGRTGYIAANYQFQFDGPPQAGAIYTAGFSLCGNGSLALGGSAVFWQCLSGSFYNLYDRDWAGQCSPVTLNTYDCTGGGPIGQSSAIVTSVVAVTATETNTAGSLAASVGLSTFTTGATVVPSSGAAIIVASNGQPGYNSTARPTPATTTTATNGTTAAITTTAASRSTGTSTKPVATSSSSAAAAHLLSFDREVAALVAGAVLAVL